MTVYDHQEPEPPVGTYSPTSDRFVLHTLGRLGSISPSLAGFHSIYQPAFPRRQLSFREIEPRSLLQEVRTNAEDAHPCPLPGTHPMPSSLTSAVQNWAAVDAPTVYASSNEDCATIDWITEPEPEDIHVSFPLGCRIHHESPYSSTPYAPLGSTV